MDKNQMMTGGGASAVNPLPSAPPSYEEAVGLQPATNPGMSQPGMMQMPMPMPGAAMQAGPMPGVPPYPVATQMPMPAPEYTRIQTMPPQHVQMPVTTQPQIHVRQIQMSLGPNPIKMSCPSCHADIKTTTMSDHQRSAHVCCIILCLVGCCLCSCLPYCLSAFLSVHHFCPSCKAYIGTWKG